MLVMIGQEAGVRAQGVVAQRVGAVIEALGHRYARLTNWMRSAAPRNIVWRTAAAVLMVPVVAGATLLQHVKYDRADLPDMEPLVRFEPPTIGHLYDARGEVLLELAREYRWVVRYPEIPVTLREAVLAAEDKNFFSHGGVDFGALPRVAGKAFLRSVAASRRASQEDGRLRIKIVFPQGGSTVTQQLVRGYFLSGITKDEDLGVLQRPTLVGRAMASVLGVPATNKLRRKVEEMRLSLWLEEDFRRRFGSRQAAKEQILARYASFIYLGNGRYGFAAASEYYFDKPLSTYQQWDADKAALLAGIAKSPKDYAPTPRNLERPRKRRDDVLRLMAKRSFISSDLAEYCARAPIALARPQAVKTEAPAVVKNAMAELSRETDGRLTLHQFANGRIRVHSTVDNRVQAAVNEALEAGLIAYEQRHPEAKGLIQGSVVVLANRDARVLAEAGGRRVFRNRTTSYTDFNRAVESFRQPGSALKPIVYMAALARGARLDTSVYDEPIAVPMGRGRAPKWIDNYDGEFKGVIPLRLALAESRNCAAVWIAEHVGMQPVLKTAYELGIRSKLQPYPTTVLGSSEVNLLELANLYRAIASGFVAEPLHRRPRDRLIRPRGVSPRAGVPAGRAAARNGGGDAGGPARRGAPAQRHRPRAGLGALPDPGDGEDGYDQRLPGRAVRGIDVRPARHHGRGAGRVRRQPGARRQGNRRTRGPSHLPRRHAARVSRGRLRLGATVPTGDGGRHRPLPAGPFGDRTGGGGSRRCGGRGPGSPGIPDGSGGAASGRRRPPSAVPGVVLHSLLGPSGALSWLAGGGPSRPAALDEHRASRDHPRGGACAVRIQGPWRDWLAEPLSRDHLVQVYTDDASLIEALAIYAGSGLGKGEAVVLVATRSHAAAVRQRLRADGLETSDLERWGQLRILDAGAVLDELLLDGLPDGDQFRVISSTLIADARAASRNGRVRVYGEMVNLLWRLGEGEAARRLEALWNEVILSYAIPLFCAYHLDEGGSLPDDLRDAHTHLVPIAACA